MPFEQGRLPRKLAAILYADVVGYSRLTGVDEDSTHRLLSDYLDLIARIVESHRGRVMHYAGDAVLAMFEAAVDALSCATKIQEDLKRRNQELPETRQVHFRIGVNIGDVIEDRGDIYGDGVNVAARLESLADPGGICISSIVHDAIFGKLDIEFESLGEKQVKNIARPVHVYRALLHQKADSEAPRARARLPGATQITGFTVIATIIVVVVGFAWWQPWKPDFAAAAVERMAFPMPAKHSIALIPFRNVSDDKKDDAFADALSEHLIALLGKLPNILVISKESSFKFAKAPVEVHEVSEQLGVHYVLKGTFQRASDDISISAQLGEALKGKRIWSGAFDLRPDDVFVGLGKIATDVASILQVPLSDEQKTALLNAPTSSVEAWLLHVRARSEEQRLTRDSNIRAREFWSQATERDPGFANAWLSISGTHWRDIRFGWTENLAESLHRAEASALRALEIDPESPGAYQLLGGAQLYRSNYEKALEYGERAAALAPNDADALAALAISQFFASQPHDAERSVNAAMRLNPFYPPWYLLPRAEAYRLSGRYDEAIRTVKEELRRIDNVPARIRLAMYYAQAGNQELARAEIRKVLNEQPKTTLASWVQMQRFKDPVQLEEDLVALENAGLPAILSWECLVRNKCP